MADPNLAEPKIRARGLAKTYRSGGTDVRALDPLDLDIHEGEFVCFLGPSGCGKSTLLRMVAGLVTPSAGVLQMDRHPIEGPGPERGLVFQEYALFPWMSVLKNVMYGPLVRGFGRTRAEALAREQIARVGLAGFESHYPAQLSGGMKQRVGIARVWANQPDVLLMDEPFGALDSITRNILQRDLLRLWLQERRTVLFVTHSVEEAIYLADRIVVMSARPGRLTAIIPVEEARPRALLAPACIAMRARLTALVEEQVILNPQDRLRAMKLAVIGLGQMGSGMATRLTGRGLDVLGFDISAAARAAAEANGVKLAASLAEALHDRSVVLTSLPDPAAVRTAWLGAGGIVELAGPGTLLIELSTIDPTTMREAAAAAAAGGLLVVDCPVSGSPKDAAAGTLVLIVGAEADALQRAEPVLAHLGAGWQHTGAPGTAKVVKIVNNMMSMGNVLVAAEAFALGTRAGVDPQTLFAVLSRSGGRSFHFEKRFPNALRGDFSPGFKVELAEKDLALAVDLGRQMRMPTPAASHARELYALALAEGFRGQDIVSLLALYTRWAQSGP